MRRFTIRTLFVVLAIAGAATNWLVAPSRIANRYRSAINNHDFAVARALCVSEHQFPNATIEHPDFFKPWATVADLTFEQLFAGRRKISVFVDYGTGNGSIASYGLECVATRKGIEIDFSMP